MEFFDLRSSVWDEDNARTDLFGVRINYRSWTIVVTHGFGHGDSSVSVYEPGMVKPADYIYEEDEVVPEPYLEKETTPDKFGEVMFEMMNVINLEIEAEEMFGGF